MSERLDLKPNGTVSVTRYFMRGKRLLNRQQRLVVVGVSYKNPRGRIHMKTLSGKKEYLIYPKDIVKVLGSVT